MRTGTDTWLPNILAHRIVLENGETVHLLIQSIIPCKNSNSYYVTANQA